MLVAVDVPVAESEGVKVCGPVLDAGGVGGVGVRPGGAPERGAEGREAGGGGK